MDENKLTQEQIETARNTDLPSLVEALGYTLTRIGRYHSTKEMDSLRIKERKTWFRYSEQTGGDAISFIMHFQGKSFPEAVRWLCEFNGQRTNELPEPHRPEKDTNRESFSLPKPYENNNRVFAYLRRRGISSQVINSLINLGLLYEESAHHNCVFVGRDKEGKAVYASLRGTYDCGASSFKGDAPGGDKSFGFRLPCEDEADTVHVYESPVDLMSFMTLQRESLGGALALCCLHDASLERYLSDFPQLKNIVFCLDNDRWGRGTAEKMASKYYELGYAAEILKPPHGKDWNEYLQAKNAEKKRRECER